MTKRARRNEIAEQDIYLAETAHGTIKMLDDLRALTKRALQYDERYIREFYQLEGYRSYPGHPPKEAREAIERAGIRLDKLPGWRD